MSTYRYQVKMTFTKHQAYAEMICQVEAGNKDAGRDMVEALLKDDDEIFADEIKILDS